VNRIFGLQRRGSPGLPKKIARADNALRIAREEIEDARLSLGELNHLAIDFQCMGFSVENCASDRHASRRRRLPAVAPFFSAQLRIAPADDALGSRVLGNESIRAGIKRSRLKLGSLHQTSKIVRLGPSDFGPVRFPTSNVPERRFQGTLTQMSQTIGTSGNELVELRGLRLLFRFELLTNLLRKAPERIVFPQLLQRIVFRGIGEGFSFERVRAAIKR
jgi:hypothetical protein